ncbi:MAG: hypothetical protein WC972_01820 [Trueperaceae bacterium]|jgi:YbbR domain-containing protein|nr:hypothetical protein [Truepera sp.]HRN18752.1 hypothetical protein [Trueperaceae bacterium]HRQ09537.1 hypothetical protein [Trueperaceae bacterium]
MIGVWGLIVELLRRLLRNWPSKLLSVLAALIVWALVTSTSTSTTQRSFLLPLEVDGVPTGASAVGVPEVVEVSVAGPSARVDRLKADQLRASLDLGDATTDFERKILVQTPSDIRLLSVNPSDVIGYLEQVTSRTIAVEVALLGPAPAGTELAASAQPARVTMTGLAQVLGQVTRAVALAPASGGTVPLLALDGRGLPVANVTFEPGSVAVTFVASEVLRVKDVPLEFTAPSAPDLTGTTLSSESVKVAGSPTALAGVTSAPATVEPPTDPAAGGRYTLPVRLTLPSGVVALSTPTVTLQYGPGRLPR